MVFCLRNFSSFLPFFKRSFGILLTVALLSCQHYPSNVEIVYKSPSGPGYKNTGSNLITGGKGRSMKGESVQSKEEIEELKPLSAIKEDAYIAPVPIAEPIVISPQESKPTVVSTTQSAVLPTAKPLQVVGAPQMASKVASQVQIHKVLAGETYYSIARTYNLLPKEIMKENNYKQGDVLKVGSIIKIPQSDKDVLISSGNLVAQVAQVKPIQNTKVNVNPKPVTPVVTPIAKPVLQNSAGSAANIQVKRPEATKIISPPVMPSSGTSSCGEKFIQPVLAKDVLFKFGEKTSGGVKNDGVIYKISSSWPVKASNNGEVAYVGDGFSDYGNIVILKHNKGYFSIYGHLMPNSLKKGQVVMRGDVISKTSIPDGKFYFSIRKGKVPVDPSKCF